MTITTSTTAKAWSPDIVTLVADDVVPDALILTHSTVAGQVQGDEPSLRVPYVDDAAATFTAEGQDIDLAEPDFDEVLVHTAKITQLIKISREQYHQESTAGRLADSARRAITRKANEAFLTQTAPTAPAVAPPAGLVSIPGIEEGSAVDGDLDALVDLVAALESNGGTPTGIIVDPLAWASLRKFKTGTGSALSILGAGTTDAQKQLLDLPVTVSNALTENSGLVIDRSSVVSAVGSIVIATSEHAYFGADSLALRATWRVGWNVVRPDRIGTFTVAGPAED